MAYYSEPAYHYGDSFGNKDENDSTKNWATKIGNVVRHPLLVNITRDVEYPDRYNKPASALSDTNLERINQRNFQRASADLQVCIEKEDMWNTVIDRQTKIRKGELAAEAKDGPFMEAKASMKTLNGKLQDAVDDRMDATQRLKEAQKAAKEDLLGKSKATYTKAPGLVWEESGNYFTNWTHAPNYMHDIMKDKQNPTTVYREICDK